MTEGVKMTPSVFYRHGENIESALQLIENQYGVPQVIK